MDLLVHVDASNPFTRSMKKTVLSIMKDLDMEDIPPATLYNKEDLVEDFTPTPKHLMPSFLQSLRIVLSSCRSIVFWRRSRRFLKSLPARAFSKSYKIHKLEKCSDSGRA